RNHLDGDDTIQRGIERLEDDASAAAADFFEDFIMIERAQLLRPGRWIEKLKRHPLAFFDLILRRHGERRQVAEFRDCQPQRLTAARFSTVEYSESAHPTICRPWSDGAAVVDS